MVVKIHGNIHQIREQEIIQVIKPGNKTTFLLFNISNFENFLIKWSNFLKVLLENNACSAYFAATTSIL